MKTIDPDAALAFFEFVKERHRIWEKRQIGLPQPWTADPVLASRKIDNVFRVLDPGSQFVLTDLDEQGLSERDLLARIVLYRLTNEPRAWRWLTAEAGWASYPTYETMGDLLVQYWSIYRDSGSRVFSGAYVITPDGNAPGTNKLEAVVGRARHMVEGDFMARWSDAPDQESRFEVLVSSPFIGDFMAMQILTDWGYSSRTTIDRENEFVRLGLGAINGAKALASSATPVEVFEWAARALSSMPDAPRLSGRPLSLMDLQGCFCEFNKYLKGPRVKEYVPAHPDGLPDPMFPVCWNMPDEGS